MRCVKISVISLLLMNLLSLSYPQALLTNNQSKKQEEVKIVDKIIKEEDKLWKVDVVIPQVSGIGDQGKENELNSKILKWTEDWINDIKGIAKENLLPEVEPSFPYEAYSRYTIGKNDGEIISFYIDYYQYTGGAHGITTRISYNVDVKSGKELGLKDLFEAGFDYKGVIDKEIKKQISMDKEKYFDQGEIFKGIKDNQNFYISGNNIVVYFGQYELAPYAAGIVEFNIDLGIFKNNYVYAKIIGK